MANPELQKKNEVTPIETERKFVIDKDRLPENLYEFPHERIDQGYLVIGADGSEARVRNRGYVYTATIKSKGTLSRGEHETSLTQDQFDDLWPATAGKRLQKTRYVIPYGIANVELDIYEGELEGLIIAEVEFESEEAATSFDAPEWFGLDVTEDKAFKNQSLALYGRAES